MIPIKKEPLGYYEATRMYERCAFCHKETDTWHEKTNNPVCEECARKHKVNELTNWLKKPKR
jgi:hypothetical protein